MSSDLDDISYSYGILDQTILDFIDFIFNYLYLNFSKFLVSTTVQLDCSDQAESNLIQSKSN